MNILRCKLIFLFYMFSVENLTKSFIQNGIKTEVFNNLSLQINKGEFVVIFGPNGCGKTTLLNIISNLDIQDKGRILKPDNLKTGYIFQNFKEALFPWLRVIDNIATPLKLKGVRKKERYGKTATLLEDLQISLDLKAFPYQLSAGQQQMVAILRGIIDQVDLLILDEPFSSLDYQTTLLMEQNLLKLWEKFKFSVLFVTHAAGEAVLLADRVIIMGNKPGRIITTLPINLSRPRFYNIITTPDFNKYKEQVIKTCFMNS